MDNLTPQQRQKNMKRIKCKDTAIELALRKALWERGHRYRKNYKGLPGHPDIVFTKYKIAIFCDGEFFHGKNWEEMKVSLQKSNNSEYWIRKISRNIERDEEVNKQLRNLGWSVLRFWGQDIKKDLNGCIKTIEEQIFGNKIGEDFIIKDRED
ncbi:very short patch repair endonuclease [[Clostridium] symbiosum]|uniref:very short patch repair endonuclease n=1 Tax=Clostridium symbiosum TaxID=1512 RepID=UPI00189F9DE2|nr:very short patch repair endonuclease [[Clostridium] symbiosum]MDB2037653.1 very short patch repair endonuclease [[Clostridium] symbiosum]